MHRLKAMVIAAALLPLSGAANAADIVGTPDSSSLYIEWNPGGGGNFDLGGRSPITYNYADAASSGSYVFTGANPFAIPAYGTGFLSWSADARSGTLRSFVSVDSTGFGLGTYQSNVGYVKLDLFERIFINEVIPDGEIVTATASMAVDGILQEDYVLTESANGYGAFVQGRIGASNNGSFLSPGSIATQFHFGHDNGTSCQFTCTFGTGPFSFAITAIGGATSNRPYIDLVYELLVLGTTYGSSFVADVSNTAHLGITLQSGYTYRSESGFFLTSADPVAVPEPGSLALVGTALLGIGLLRRSRRAMP